ncbi:MAG: two-component sensor histidine kinase, partial [Lachnospiraceae bacterium]|nr:two-component sensor histidine kinase [Lachnospiraceae bacterium]
MKHSVKQQIAVIFIAVMAGTVALCWIANNLFLEKFYIENKTNAIQDAYVRINEAASNGDIVSDAFDLELRKTCDMYNIGIVVIDAQSNII